MDKELNLLTKITPVEAPEFLYTRILNSIENNVTHTISTGWKWATAVCLSCVIALNVFAFSSFDNTTSQEDSYSLNTLNLLYDE